ncbi:SIR2 family NAD-dependent protein deacylase [Sphingobacterium spiritivorum]|uniref:SIR2 family NAD-dependent protein deacylase n=1 Tax=Sphingobacterium spiritivorum TaxID=258 RepID=UPI003DA303B1
MKRIVVFTGAGISAESGLKTFRGDDGLWEGNHVEDVATPEAWQRNPALVQQFYNDRRKQCLLAEPNTAHQALVRLENQYHVDIITQNIDNLHERAGSKNILHLHGQITQSRSSKDPSCIYEIKGEELKMGELCKWGSQLRPNIVWFGEAVPAMIPAIRIAQQADILIVIGTSLQVYPAANLIHDIPPHCEIFLIDPSADQYRVPERTVTITSKASEGVPELVEQLLSRI